MKEIIRPKTQNYTIHLPKEYINQDVMIQIDLISPGELQRMDRSEKIKKTAGILSKRKIDPVTLQREIRDEW